MTITMSIRNVGYLGDADVRIWAAMAYWRAEEALFLSMNICPKKDGEENDESNALELGRDYQFKQEMVERAVTRGELQYVETPYLAEGPDGTEVRNEISYVPSAYVKWAVGRLPDFPIKLYKAIKDKYQDEFINMIDPIEIAREPETKLRPSNLAKERCRAIAEMLWDQDASIKTKDMIVHPSIKKYGAGMYEPNTIYDWIKDLAPKNREANNTIDGFEC